MKHFKPYFASLTILSIALQLLFPLSWDQIAVLLSLSMMKHKSSSMSFCLGTWIDCLTWKCERSFASVVSQAYNLLHGHHQPATCKINYNMSLKILTWRQEARLSSARLCLVSLINVIWRRFKFVTGRPWQHACSITSAISERKSMAIWWRKQPWGLFLLSTMIIVGHRTLQSKYTPTWGHQFWGR